MWREATREIYWNIDIPWRTGAIFVLGMIPLAVAGWGLLRQYRRWQALGQGEVSWDHLGERLGRLAVEVFGQRRLLLRAYPGILHLCIFFGILILFIGTLIVAFQADVADPLLGWHFFKGAFYLGFSLVLDLAGIAALLGICMALWRRSVLKPKFIESERNWAGILWLLLAVIVSGFLVEGLRIAATQPAHGMWSPGGMAIGRLLRGMDESRLLAAHKIVWWGHLFVSEAAVACAGYGALSHIFIVPANILAGQEVPTGRIEPIRDFETAEEFGVSRPNLFTKKQLLDVAACVECGRCEQVCPAHATGKPLNPKRIIAGIRDVWLPAAEAALRKEETSDPRALIGKSVETDAIWSCTTCGACERECPAMIPQIDKIVDMRRHLTLMESKFPPEAQRLFSNLEQQGNPWGLDASKRADWASELDVPLWEGEGCAEYLLWVGCAGAYDERAKPVSIAIVKLLKAAGVRIAILGAEERCTGDAALRLGNDYLYQMLAEQNIETLKSKGVKKIITSCPHCMQTLGKEYRSLGGEFDVVHHSQILDQLIQESRLKTANGANSRIAIHDSCYLGRHNGLYEEQRGIVRGAGASPVEMKRNRERGFCCGGGGGRVWLEETLGKLVNVERAEEACNTGCDQVATSCPFCKTMMIDGIKDLAREESPEVRDIAEILAQSLPQ
jgi:Fe-S oxidoreductase/nitrate reductase gamma subunit